MMAKKKKIYYLPIYGQLGNWLSVLAHLVAFSLENNFEIVLFKTDNLYKILKKNNDKTGMFRFSKLLSNPVFSFFINNTIKYSFFNKNKYFLRGLFVNQPFNIDEELQNRRMPRFVAMTNWLFRYNSGVIKHQNEIRNILAFDDSSFTNAREILKTVQCKYSDYTLIGVHVRRGDYATWLNGRFFYDNDVYYSKMKCMAEQLGKCVFIICTNEEFRFDNDLNLNILYAKGSPSEDIFLLSKCKYIIGPPSTFSSYAAFLGDQHLLFLETKEDDVKLDRFKKYYLQ